MYGQTGADMDEAQLAELQVLRGRVVEVQALQVAHASDQHWFAACWNCATCRVFEAGL